MTGSSRRRRTRGAALIVLVVALLVSPVPATAQDAPAPTDPPIDDAAQPAADPCADARVWERPACRVGEGVSQAVGSVVGAGVGSVFDQLFEWVAQGATWLLGQLVALIDSSTGPALGAEWFARQYRLMASLAVALVMPLLMIATLTAVVGQDWRGLVKTYLVYLPAALLTTGMAIPLVDIGLGVTDWMCGLLVDGLRGDVERFLAGVSQALAVGGAAASPVGAGGVAPSLAFLGAATIALGAFAVWVELVLRAAGIYVAVFLLPLGLMALVWPSTRRWCTRLVKAIVALVLSKFVIVAVIALAAAALGDAGSAGFAGIVSGAALMLMAAFAPLVLFRLADVAGDDMAAAVAGVTQQRTAPMPVPTGRQTTAQLYSRIIHARAARDGAGGAVAAGNGAAAGPAAAGVAVGTAVLRATQAGDVAGRAGGQRLGGLVAHGHGGNGSGPAGSGVADAGGVDSGSPLQPGGGTDPGGRSIDEAPRPPRPEQGPDASRPAPEPRSARKPRPPAPPPISPEP